MNLEFNAKLRENDLTVSGIAARPLTRQRRRFTECLVLYRHRTQNVLPQGELIQLLRAWGVSPIFPGNRALRTLYEELQRKLNRLFPEAAHPTMTEFIFRQQLTRFSALKLYPGTWCGNHCIDLFLPAVAGELKGRGAATARSRGLAIEVDGDVHDFEPKIKRDQNKRDFLSALGIAVTSVPNEEILNGKIMDVLRRFNRLPRIDSRARKRLWRRVAYETIIAHASPQEMTSLFGFDVDNLATRLELQNE